MPNVTVFLILNADSQWQDLEGAVGALVLGNRMERH